MLTTTCVCGGVGWRREPSTPLALMRKGTSYPCNWSWSHHHHRLLEDLRASLGASCPVGVRGASVLWGMALRPYVDGRHVASASHRALRPLHTGTTGDWNAIGDERAEADNDRLSRYKVITPTCWNASPNHGAGFADPLEQSLAGTPLLDPHRPAEALRVVHSFDPCLSDAVHLIRGHHGSRRGQRGPRRTSSHLRGWTVFA